MDKNLNKIFLVDPFNNKSLYKDKLFDSPFIYLQSELKNFKIELHTLDYCSIEMADKVLFFNFNKKLLRKCIKCGKKKEDLILFLWEPKSEIPLQFIKKNHDYFYKIFTMYELNHNIKKYYHFNYPQGQTFKYELLSFKERKFLTLINSNKYCYNKYEFYSKRMDFIKYADNKNFEFDLYGINWEKNLINIYRRKTINLFISALKNKKITNFINDLLYSGRKIKNYKGKTNDKYNVLEMYKFCICFVNEDGYLSEKIFDCLFTGTIPIYWGYCKIENYLPKKCYIDFRDFDFNYDKLITYLNEFEEEKFNEMQKAGRDFILSDEFLKWKPEVLFKNIAKQLIS